MGGNPQEVPVLIVIMFLFWGLKISIFKVKKIEWANDEKFWVVKILEKNPIINLGFMCIWYLMMVEALFITDWKFIAVKCISGILLLISVITTFKITIINFKSLIQNGEKKIWCWTYIFILGLVLIFPIFVGFMLFSLGMGLAVIYLAMIFVINILEVKKFLF
jgi:hypothetical protein